MAYTLKYFADFKDRSNNSLRLEIYTQSAASAAEIKLSSDAMTIEYSADNLFSPLKMSRASINLFVQQPLTDLFSGSLFGTYVKLYKNNSLFWFGYATPNIYTQSYVGKWDILTLECIDCISQLQNIDYSLAVNDSSGIASFISIITHCLSAVDPQHIITSLYIDRGITVNSSIALAALSIKERNFFDEKNEPEKLDSVVSSILQYLGLTLIQYKGAFYIIQQTAKLHSTYSVRRYVYTNAWSDSGNNFNLSVIPKSSAQLGLAGSDTSITLDGVFNKVTVIANNNPLSDILPDFDDDDIINQDADPSHYETESYTGSDNTSYTLVSGFFKSESNWTYSQPVAGDPIIPTPVNEVTISNRDTLVGGVFWQKVFHYETGFEPSSPDYRTYITMCGNQWYTQYEMLSLNRTQSMILDGGYLIINLKYKLSTDMRAHTVVRSMYDSAATYGSCSDLMWNSDTGNIGNGNWPNNTLFVAKISIGDYTYNGEEWISQSEFNTKRTYWNSIYSGWGVDWGSGEKWWYAVPDTNYSDELLYVPQSVYNASASPLKKSGKCPANNASKVYQNTYSQWIYIPEEFYNKLYYGDRCFLAHINKTNECIYDCEYSLTNTVSYKMNIVDASDGVAIPCPTDKSLYGQLNFTLYQPITSAKKILLLGSNPQYRSDKASTTCRAIHISDLTIEYKKSTEYKDVFSTAKVDPDTIYTNVVNDSYCKELDDVELRVNTRNDWATSYSYALTLSGNDYLYIDDVTFDGVTRKPEERLIERLVNHYKIPKYQMSVTVHNDYEIQPFAPIVETINGSTKQMVVNSATYNVSADTVTITSNEI